VGIRRAVLGLGLLAGAILQAPLGAQQPTPPPDTARRRPDSAVVRIPIRPDTIPMDSVERRRAAQRDSAAERLKSDTLRAPLGQPDIPPTLDIGPSYRWSRAELFATGVMTLSELLERIPGVTAFRSGWIPTPTTTAYMGEMRVRLFYDGVELDPMDERTGGVHDLAAIQLWTLEELSIERGAAEIRVHMRSWSIDKTIPNTRTDVYTGDEDTNIYRGFFGRRYAHGEALQLAAQQYNTQSSRGGAGGDLLSLLGRIGWARGGWHADAFLLRTRRARTNQKTLLRDAILPGQDASRTDAYLRAGFGEPERRLWLQVIAASMRAGASPKDVDTLSAAAGNAILPPDSLRGQPLVPGNDHSRAQYVLTGGLAGRGARLTLTERYRVYDGRHLGSPSLRATFDRRWLAVSLLAERIHADSAFRTPRRGSYHDTLRTVDVLDASVRVMPLSFLALAGAAGRRREYGGGQDSLTSTWLRGEAGVRLGGLWLSAGVLSRDTAVLVAPLLFGTQFRPYREGMRVAQFAAIRGRVWKAINADVSGLMWATDSVRYRPRYQGRAELFVKTDWRRRFPSGNFGLLFSVRGDYRSNVRFPVVTFPVTDAWVTSQQSRILSSMLEIRILNAVVTWQYRNLLGSRYDIIPGYEMPHQVNLYGVRWDFWN